MCKILYKGKIDSKWWLVSTLIVKLRGKTLKAITMVDINRRWQICVKTFVWNIVGKSMFCHNLLLFMLYILNLENSKHLSINKSKISICKKIPLGT